MSSRLLLSWGGLKRSPGFIIIRTNESWSGENAGRAAFETVRGVIGCTQLFVLLFIITKVWNVTDIFLVSICEVVGYVTVEDEVMQSFCRFYC